MDEEKMEISMRQQIKGLYHTGKIKELDRLQLLECLDKHDREVESNIVAIYIDELMKYATKDDYPIICMDEWTLKRLAEEVKRKE